MDLTCLAPFLFIVPLFIAAWVVAARISEGSEGPAPRFDIDMLAKDSGRRALRRHDVPQTVAGRADELARTLVNSVKLGGPGILKTYVEDETATQLYHDALELLQLVEGKGRLGVELWPPQVVNNPEAPIQVDVRYVMHSLDTPSEKRILRLEKWFWGPRPRRCEVCGAPNKSESGDCEYCGASVADQQRWILRSVDVTASPGFSEAH